MKLLERIIPAFENIEFGSINIELPNKELKYFKAKDGQNFIKDIPNAPDAEIKIYDWSVIESCLQKGDIGLGESYINNYWDSSNISSLLLFFTLNAKVFEKFFHAKPINAIILGLQSLLKKNTKKGSKKNIYAHYDLGNGFYKLWLDRSMTDSSGIFSEDIKSQPDKESLLKSQINKYQRIIEKIGLDNDVLEIGCGWGGFLNYATKSQKHITSLTISHEQENFARSLIAENNLQDKAKVVICDYRDCTGQFDAVVSIEMFEAVGREYWATYFKQIYKCLRPKGIAVIQTITIDNEIFNKYKKRTDFIQKYIFPGGVLPSKKIFKNMAEKCGLRVVEEYCFGFDYYLTIKIWLDNFDKSLVLINELGFSDNFIRKWRFYLAYCMAGFASKRTDVVQFTLVKDQ